jgi:toxin ParE1/3/4
VVDRILSSAESLVHFPYMGHIGRARDTFEWAVPGLPYIVIYKVDSDADEIVVVAIFHGAQDRELER